MIELVIVSRLLEYPDAALWQHQQELFDALASSENLDKEDAQTLGVFLRDLSLTVAARHRCCCLNMFTVNPAIAVRLWLT